MWELPKIDTLEESSAAMHELFLSLREAGFTKHECWHIMLGAVDCRRKDCHRPGAP